MRMKLAVILLALTLPAFAQTKPSPCPNHAEMKEELTETKGLVARMQNRIVVMRNAAGTVSDFEVRNALQVNADSWQDLLDSMKHHLDRLQTEIDRCDAREKIESAKPK